MDLRKIALGLAAWFLGIIVPVLHHTMVVSAVMKQPNQSPNFVHRLFETLPWIDYAYLLAMGIVGVVLILSGMKSSASNT
ncbi:MAG: hypothetical protein ACYTBJ_25425, partial [Planctomycetota bacterium]